MRPIIYIGSTKKDLDKLPAAVKDTFLSGLDGASEGEDVYNSKPLKGFGNRTVLEICEDYKTDTYRAVYTVKFKEAVYVLHVFKKKSNKGISTPQKDIDLIKQRLKSAEMHYKQNYGKGK